MAADTNTPDDHRSLEQLIADSLELQAKANDLVKRLHELQQVIARRKKDLGKVEVE